MTLCISCAAEVYNHDSPLCSHHLIMESEWSAANRIWCDLLHRGRTPVRLAPDDRDALDASNTVPAASAETWADLG